MNAPPSSSRDAAAARKPRVCGARVTAILALLALDYRGADCIGGRSASTRLSTIYIQFSSNRSSPIKISDMKIPMLSSFEAAKIPNRSDPLPLLNLRNFEQIGMIRMEFRGFRSIRKSV